MMPAIRTTAVSTTAALMIGIAAAPPSAANGDSLLIEGTVTSNGTVAPGEVTALLWPSVERLKELPEGSPVDLLSIGSDLIAGDGSYTIHLDPKEVPPGYMGQGGQIDVEIMTSSNSGNGSWMTTLRRSGKAGSTERWIDAGVGDAVSAYSPRVDFDLASGRVTPSALTSQDGEIHPRDLPTIEVDRATPMRGSTSPVGTEISAMEPICSVTKKGLTTGVSAKMMKAQGLSNVPVTVDFNAGSSQTFGIAVQSAGGNWSSNGTGTISSSGGGERTWSTTVHPQNKVNYRRYHNDCTNRNTHRPESIHSILSGGPAATRSTYPAANCTAYSSGNYWKSHGTNFTISGGVSFPGISLSAQTGWNSATRINWKFKSKAKLCGSSSLGWASSSWAGAQPL